MNVLMRASYSESRMPRCVATLIVDDHERATTERTETNGEHGNMFSCVTLGRLVAAARQHRQDGVSAKRWIGLRKTAAIKHRLFGRRDHIDEAARRAEADASGRGIPGGFGHHGGAERLR